MIRREPALPKINYSFELTRAMAAFKRLSRKKKIAQSYSW
jgi:hypothetical protein